MSRTDANLLALTLVLALCLACGGGGGSGSSTLASTSIQGTGSGTTTSKVSGPIDQFGSLVVAGITFDTDEVLPTIETEEGVFEDLEVGMWVTVQGNVNADGSTGIATSVEYEAHHAGRIEDLSTSGNHFDLNGIRIATDESTIYGREVSTPLMEDQSVSVSGQYSSDGSFWATYIGPNTTDRQRTRSRNELKVELEEDLFLAFFVDLGELAQEEDHYDLDDEDFDLDFSEAVELSGRDRPPKESERVLVRGRLDDDGDLLVLSYLNRDFDEELEDEEDEEELQEDSGEVTEIRRSSQQIFIDGDLFYVRPFTRFRDRSDERLRNFGLKELQAGDRVYYEAFENDVLERLDRID